MPHQDGVLWCHVDGAAADVTIWPSGLVTLTLPPTDMTSDEVWELSMVLADAANRTLLGKAQAAYRPPVRVDIDPDV